MLPLISVVRRFHLALNFGCGCSIKNSAGVLYANASHYSSTLDCFLDGTSNVPAVTAACSGGGGSLMYAPMAIVGYTAQPSVCVVGDSRIWGQGDSLSDATGDVGEIVRAIGPLFGYTKLASSGVTAASTSTHFVTRLAIANYCTHVIDELGINDLAASTAAATIASYRTTLAGLWPSAITFGTTICRKRHLPTASRRRPIKPSRSIHQHSMP